LRQVATIVTPDTILRWYRRLIAHCSAVPYLTTRRSTPRKERAAQNAASARTTTVWP
jgi:hypothetical protein